MLYLTNEMLGSLVSFLHHTLREQSCAANNIKFVSLQEKDAIYATVISTVVLSGVNSLFLVLCAHMPYGTTLALYPHCNLMFTAL